MQNIIAILNGIFVGGNPSGSGVVPFSPASIAGLKLWLNSDAANVNTEAAAEFNTANNLSSTSTDFDFHNSSFSVCGWVYLSILGSIKYHFTKWDSAGSQRAISITTNSSGDIRMFLSNTGSGATSTVISSTQLSTNTWYFISAVFDFDNSKSKISVNGSAFDEVTETNVLSSTAPVRLNAINASVGSQIQREDLFCVYSKALSLLEVQALYNSNNATSYADLTDAQKVSLVSWWSLSERSGIRYDQHGTNNLTDNNSVGWAAGVLDEPVVNNSPVSLWIDKSTATNNATQGTAINQPTWLSTTPSVDFDFTTNNQSLNINNVLSDVSATTTGTWCGWFRLPDSTPAGVMGFITFGGTNVNSFLYCGLLSDGRLTFRSRINAVDKWFLETDAAITSDDLWVHIACIQDGVSPVIKINNVVVAQAFSVPDVKTTWFNDDSLLDNGAIGILNFASINAVPLAGESQQIQIYDTNLSDADLTSIYEYNPPPPPVFMIATGGDVPAGTIDGDYKVHTFNSSSNFTIEYLGSDPTYGSSVEYLIVGGGGGGGYETGGGGGAGGLLTATSATVEVTSYAATVGAGGSGAVSSSSGANGGDSSIFSITAVGGGVGGQSLNPYYGNGKLSLTADDLLGSISTNPTDATNGTYTNVTLSGGSGTGGLATVVVSGNTITSITVTTEGLGYIVTDVLSIASAVLGSGSSAEITLVSEDLKNESVVGKNGGSGGGGKRGFAAGGLGTEGQGNDGGQGGAISGTYVACAGGGGGAGVVGQAGGTRGAGFGGNGGDGLQNNISGINTYYAGGGGGASYEDTNVLFGLGGNGGGGRAASRNVLAVAGTANTAGGGGAGCLHNGGVDDKWNGAAGGSGIVIVRYKFQ
jgi:hypothetical protein